VTAHIPGPCYLGDGSCRFTVWAPFHGEVSLRMLDDVPLTHRMHSKERGYHTLDLENIKPRTRYKYVLSDGNEYPDPASRYQPEGVHGPSEVTCEVFPWTDEKWSGSALEDYIIYELHVGTFTPEGTFEAAAARLPELKAIGINAVELMPVAQFPGTRNWGYDGTYPYAVQNSYGGPSNLKAFVDCCHAHGIAAVLDVVYNHFGPEGNYAGQFAPYFTETYKTPWGRAINFDGPHSDEVRRFFIENALYWLREFHFDALRLDALHAILDTSAYPFLAELVDSVADESTRQHRPLYLIGESDLNDPRLIQDRRSGGIGIDAQWSDDFHHSLHTLLTDERTGYYADFGSVEHLASAYKEGFVYSGQYSLYRQRRHGAPSTHIPSHRFVVCAQNHDQVGNRFAGDRLTTLVSPDAARLAAACVLLGPFIPLLFMGEEYGETAPFPYFVSHSDEALIDAVRKGRREEFSAFHWQGEFPDPQDEKTFRKAVLQWPDAGESQHSVRALLYRELISLRDSLPALKRGKTAVVELKSGRDALALARGHDDAELILVLNFSPGENTVHLEMAHGTWKRRLDSSEARWGGQGSPVPEYIDSEGMTTLRMAPQSAVLLERAKKE